MQPPDPESPRPRPLPAFDQPDFMHSSDARVLRVIAELLEPQYRLERMGIEDTIVFFGSARAPAQGDTATSAQLAAAYQAARELSRRLTAWSRSRPNQRQFMVCSGGGPGIMEAANRGAMDAGGESIGLGIGIPEEEAMNAYVTPELAFNFHYFFIRKFWFVYNAKALVFFPGGFGTLDELMEVLTLVQTRKVRKRMGIILYDSAFWSEVLDFEALAKHGVIAQEDLDLVRTVDSVDDAFHLLRAFLEENYGPTLLEHA